MASINKREKDGYECATLTDTAFGKRMQYAVKLGDYSAKQWLNAHSAVMQALEPTERQELSNANIRRLVSELLKASKDLKKEVKKSGIDAKLFLSKKETSFEKVFADYEETICNDKINSATKVANIKRQLKILRSFIKTFQEIEYSRLTRNMLASYPAWRAKNMQDGRGDRASADTLTKELNRLAAVIRHGVKYHGWQERYLLDDIKVKATTENTRAIRPFEIAEIKTIMEWLRDYSAKIGSWHLHDMVLLALCFGMEAKALDKMRREWWRMDLGLLRVYDKLVSGVIDAKTQNRARDVPITPVMRRIYERGHIFTRPKPQARNTPSGTEFRAWAESQLRKCEAETGIKDVNLHRFRHTCATARLSAGWQLIRVSRMLGHRGVNTTAKHYAEYDYAASPQGFEGMIAVYKEFCEWLDDGYFTAV